MGDLAADTEIERLDDGRFRAAPSGPRSPTGSCRPRCQPTPSGLLASSRSRSRSSSGVPVGQPVRTGSGRTSTPNRLGSSNRGRRPIGRTRGCSRTSSDRPSTRTWRFTGRPPASHGSWPTAQHRCRRAGCSVGTLESGRRAVSCTPVAAVSASIGVRSDRARLHPGGSTLLVVVDVRLVAHREADVVEAVEEAVLDGSVELE